MTTSPRAETVCPCDEFFVDYVTRRTSCVRCGRPPRPRLVGECWSDDEGPEDAHGMPQSDGSEEA